MNRAYKIIWSHVRDCYVVVSEIAKSHGKNNVKSIFGQLAERAAEAAASRFGQSGGRWIAAPVRTAGRWALPLATAGLLLQTATGFASVITDAKGTSLVSATEKVHNLYTQKVLSGENRRHHPAGRVGAREQLAGCTRLYRRGQHL